MKTLREIDWPSVKAGPKHPSPPHWEDQVFYFLMVDRFSDNNEAGHAHGGSTPLYNPQDNGNAITSPEEAEKWRQAGQGWTGGNIKGLTNKIPYLKEMGITAIWLSPILKQVPFANSYHGYGIQDFLTIDPHFGSDNNPDTAKEEFRNFVQEAHAAGIYVILDVILNHSGNVFGYDLHMDDQIPAWNGQTFPIKGFRTKTGEPVLQPEPVLIGDPDSAIWPREFQNTSYFTRKGKIRNWDYYPEYLEGDFESLKDLNLGDGQIDDYHPTPALMDLCEVYKYWIAYADLDGFRIDTIKHMEPGAVRYLVSVFHEFAETIGKDNFYLIGEITGGRQRAVETMENTGLNAALGIDDIQDRLERTIKGTGRPVDYFDLFRNSIFVRKESHTWFLDRVVTMIDDHDKVSNGQYKHRFSAGGYGSLVFNAIAFNLTTIGIPCIYYGTEQGFDGEGGSDQYIRECMFGGPFGAFRSKERHFFDTQNSTYSEVRKIADLRKRLIALRRGRQYLREISGNGVSFGLPDFVGESRAIRSIIAWSRIMSESEVLVVFNNDPQNQQTAWVTIDNGLHEVGDVFHCVYRSDGILTPIEVAPRNGRAVELSLPPGVFAVYSKDDF